MVDISQALASAIQFHRSGKLAEAERRYREILALQPDHPETLHLLGALALQQGRPSEAVELIARAVAIVPSGAAYLTNLGAAYAALKQWDQAAEYLRRAVAANSNSAQAHFQLGIVQRHQGQFEGAAASFERAVALDPARVDAHYNLGNTWKDLERFDAAERCYREAIRRQPGLLIALNNLGSVLRLQGRLDEAVETLRQAVEMQPDSAPAHVNLGTALGDLGRFDEAVACFRQALAIDPRLVQAHSNLGRVLHSVGRLDDALAHYDEAIRLMPDDAETHCSRAYVLLSRGDYAQGWADNEWRLKSKGYSGARYRQPQWDGSPLGDRTLLVNAELGLGDVLQFIRYIPLVRQQGARVLVGVQNILLPLLTASGYDDLVAEGSKLPDFDVHVSLLSLPGILGTTLETIPNQVPYLAADPQLTEHWRQRLAAFEGFKIGIVWQGSPKYKFDRFRSIALADYRPLAEVPGTCLVSLQKGLGTEQIAAADRVPLVDLGPNFDEAAGAFMDTAAVMKNLDLVVTCDTATGHLAGALGVPVWVALPFVADWRWLIDRDDSPWYPTARLFRQPRAGDWNDVFQRMAAALAPMAAR